MRFHHLQHEEDKLAWQGAQLDFLGFDELTHFTESQVFYLISRLRHATVGSTHKPVMRATTNPDPDSWVKRFLAPWVDDEYPDPAASGEVRWFYRDGDTICWLHKPSERPAYVPRENVYSVTFIQAHLEDNPPLLESDPGYRGRIQALPLLERTILSGGPLAWKIRPSGNMFRREWFDIVPVAPAAEQFEAVVRRWDLAGTEPRKGYSDPDWTVGVKMGRTTGGVYYVLDAVFVRESPAKVKALARQVATLDGVSVEQRFPQDPGQAGKGQLDDFVTMLDGYVVGGDPETGDKQTRAKPLSAQAEVGNVKLVAGHWNEQWLSQMCAFPNPRVHDDAVDASSGAYARLVQIGGATVAIGVTRQSVSPWERAREDRARLAEQLRARREEIAAAAAAAAGVNTEEMDPDAEEARLIAEVAAAEGAEAGRDPSVPPWVEPEPETPQERERRIRAETQIASAMQDLARRFGNATPPNGGFGTNRW